MFNVTVLKMKDIKKYVVGMLLTIVVIIIVSQYFPLLMQKKKSVPQWMTENSMIECLDQAVPTMASINEEYKKIAKEEDEIAEDKFLQGILKTQISSMQGIEKQSIEVKEEAVAKEEVEQELQAPKEEAIELARKWFSDRSDY